MIVVRLDVTQIERGVRAVWPALDRNIGMALSMSGELVAGAARRTGLFTDRTGKLRNSIMAAQPSGTFSAGTTSLAIEAGAESTTYAPAVHDGSVPHEIRPRRGRKALRFAVAGGYAFAKVVRHPGTRARPFMSEALDATEPRFGVIFGQALEASFAEAFG